MELHNPTRLQALAFRQFDQDGDLDCIVAVRGTFLHVQAAVAEWAAIQEPFQWEDSYDGDPHQSPLLRQSDLTPGKVGTDVTFLGTAHAPLGSQTAWSCGLKVGTISKELYVSGPRSWLPEIQPVRPWRNESVSAWSLGPPEPVETVAMDWRLAAGGANAFDPEGQPDDRNPIGCGRIGPVETWQNQSLPAPQILTELHPKPGRSLPPAGFGPLSPFWRDRARHAGTYDDAWVAHRHPLLPQDFDPRFWQCAPPDQIAIPFLQGNEPYRLTNLWSGLPVAEGRLPGLQLAVEVNGTGWRPLDLDGVQFDWRERPLILLTWRARFPLPEALGAKLRLGWRLMDAHPNREAAE